jgi:rhomboid-like protein
MHLGMNMFVLYTVSGPLERRIGPEATWTTFAASGIAAAYASTAFKIARGVAIPSLGASGGIAGLLAAIAVIEPDAQFAIIFLPMLTLPAKAFLPALAALEVVGMLRGWRMMDHAAHLGGLCFGAASTALVDRKEVFGTR